MPVFNFLAISIAALIPLLFGAIWYLPSVTGNQLSKLNISDASKDTGHPPMVYVMTLVLSFLISMTIAGILGAHEPHEVTLTHGLFHGAAAAIFLGIPTFMVIALFESKPAKYILIHALYWLISMTIMGGIIGAFGIGA